MRAHLKAHRFAPRTGLIACWLGLLAWAPARAQQFNSDNYLSKPAGVATVILTFGQQSDMVMTTFSLLPRWEFTYAAYIVNADQDRSTDDGYSTSLYFKYMIHENAAKTGGVALKGGTGLDRGLPDERGPGGRLPDVVGECAGDIPLLRQQAFVGPDAGGELHQRHRGRHRRRVGVHLLHPARVVSQEPEAPQWWARSSGGPATWRPRQGIETMQALSGLTGKTAYPWLARNTTVGALMRRRIKPQATPISQAVLALRTPLAMQDTDDREHHASQQP